MHHYLFSTTPQLQLGQSTELVVTGDFADQEDVLLPGDYLTFISQTPTVAVVSATGQLTGLSHGTTILNAARGNLQAVTAARVGTQDAPENDAQMYIALAEAYGLDVYPSAVTLTPGITRQMLVGLKGVSDSPDLHSANTGTRYFVNNSGVLQITPDGLLTTLAEGNANVTVLHGASEVVVPVFVQASEIGPTTLDAEGGIVQGSDGSQVMVAPGALSENVTVSIAPVAVADLTLSAPTDFDFVSAFELDMGDELLSVATQLAIPAPAGLEVGEEVFFMRQGELPDATGSLNPIWLVEDAGIVGADGMIRTSSPPWPGVTAGGLYSIAASKYQYSVVDTQLRVDAINLAAGATILGLAISAGFGVYLGAAALTAKATVVGGVLGSATVVPAISNGVLTGTGIALGSLASVLTLPFIYTGNPTTLSQATAGVILPTGAPIMAPLDVQFYSSGQPFLSTTLSPTTNLADALNEPVIQEIELMQNHAYVNNYGSIVRLRGNNFLVNTGIDSLGSDFSDLAVRFYRGDSYIEVPTIPLFNQNLGSNNYEIAVDIPQTTFVSDTEVVLVQKRKVRTGTRPTDIAEVTVETEPVRVPVRPDICVTVAVQRLTPRVSLIDSGHAASIVQTASNGSAGLLEAVVPINGITNWRGRLSAMTSDGARTYLPMESFNEIVPFDSAALQQVDADPDTPGFDPIQLPAGAAVADMVIGPQDRYAYVADQRQGQVYVIDLQAAADTYNQVIETIDVGNPSSLLNRMAISNDGRRLFITGRTSPTANDSQILVVNIDPEDRPTAPGSNPNHWHQQIGEINSGKYTMGIAAVPAAATPDDQIRMVFTNRQDESRGFGTLTVTNDDPNAFAASLTYAGTNLGSNQDFFDVNEPVDVTITSDGAYAFVAARNWFNFGRGIESIDGVLAGGNVGIIKDPLGASPKLVAATRPIPLGLTEAVELSNNGRHLLASYPFGGGVYVFDVPQIIDTIENANLQQLSTLPLDEINPAISIAADYTIVSQNSQQVVFNVPNGSKRGPIPLSTPMGLTTAPVDWLRLVSPVESSSSSNPTFKWEFNPNEPNEPDPCAPPNFDWDDNIQLVNLYVSVFPRNRGLLPSDPLAPSSIPAGLNPDKLSNGSDYNPQRILTATWKQSDPIWRWNGGSSGNDNKSFTLPPELTLTAGQTYYWAVEARAKDRRDTVKFGQFTAPAPQPISGNTFSSVTVLTDDGSAFATANIFNLANNIARVDDGAVMFYDSTDGSWDAYPSEKQPTYGKPLVLVTDWRQDSSPDNLNAGFAEAAADAFFASLVDYNNSFGNDALFNSPMHFIGFGRGAVVNSEIIQLLGTFFPASEHAAKFPDLQMTTIDPNDFLQNLLPDLQDPKVQVWQNVTYADNYYQWVPTNPYSLTPTGRDIPQLPLSEQSLNAPGLRLPTTDPRTDWPTSTAPFIGEPDLKVFLGGSDPAVAGDTLKPESRAGFTRDDNPRNPHERALAWYGGTTNLGWSETNPLGYPILRRSVDFAEAELFDPSFPDARPWYSPEHAGYPVGYPEAPWEGIGTGWFYSALGGGKNKRLLSYPSSYRIPLDFDNTYNARMRGDAPVPTVFNGNFDAIRTAIPSQQIPGWSFHNSTAPLQQHHLVNVSPIPGATYTGGEPNYALQLGGGGPTSVTHNRLVVPDWGVLRFDIHLPSGFGGSFRVSIEGQYGTQEQVVELVEANGPYTNGYNDADTYRVGYGVQGFETFHVNVSEAFRGQVVTLKFEVENGGTVYLDDVFFKSEHLLLGMPTLNGIEARRDASSHPFNFLIERPQYSLSYDDSIRGPSWVSYQLNQTWTGNLMRPSGDTSRWQPDPWLLPPLVGTTTGEYAGGYHRGHMTTRSHRNRTQKDQWSTYLTASMLPQHPDNNSDIFQSAWVNLENYARNLVRQTSNSKELYIISGGYNSLNNTLPANHALNQNNINLPEFTWKVIVVLKPGQSVADITTDTRIISVVTPNIAKPTDPSTWPQWRDWGNWRRSVDFIEAQTGLDLLTNVPLEIQNIIEALVDTGPTTLTASLLAYLPNKNDKGVSLPDSASLFDTDAGAESVLPDGTFDNLAFWNDGFTEESTLVGETSQGTLQVSSSQIGLIQNGFAQVGSAQVGTTQVSSSQVCTTQFSSTQVNTPQLSVSQVDTPQIDPREIYLPTSITSEQLLSIHNSTPASIYTINNSAQALWNSLLNPQIEFDINLIVKDLPAGQLAEAQITKFDQQGRPNGGTILIDTDANAKGWFVDPTPLDHTEFNSSLSESAYSASTDSAAFGHYDLLTALLHEMGHLAGFIDGYWGFERRLQTLNGSRLFVTPDFTVSLVDNHLDPKVYPTDLLNPILSPGVRKLPSTLDAQLLNAIRSEEGQIGKWGDGEMAALTSPLTSSPLVGILNGRFNSSDSTDPDYGWSTRGSSAILNGQAVLSEGDRLLSNFSQTFVIPEGAKYLQFTLLDTELGDSSELDPPDAFEVALLNANTLTSLVGTTTGLTQTDAFLNLQHTGQAYFSPQVTLPGASTSGSTVSLNSPRTVRVDLSGVTAGTIATLYFDLLGFGEQDSSVRIDNVRLVSDALVPPVANNDTATTDQAKPVIVNVLTNDRDADGTLDPTTLAISSALANGTVLVNSNGTITYTPTPSFIGTDSFTYTVADDDGEPSNQATVTVTVNNVSPTISNLTGDTPVDEGTSANFTATATDPGNDTLTYTWDFGDGSDSVTGRAVTHVFADNGTYTTTLSVTDADGGQSSQTLSVNVNNVAPVVEAGEDLTVDAGQAVTFNGSFIDPGVFDTHTILWDFGDGTSASNTLTPQHTYTNDGTYSVLLSVRDSDGGVNSDTLTMTVKQLPTLVIEDRTITEGNKGSTNAGFTVSLSTASAVAVTVNFATANSTATAGTDYTATNGTLTFAPGQTTQTISVPVIGDRLYEPDETFFLNLSSASNAAIADAQGVGTILDNDEAPSLIINDRSITEGNNGSTNAVFSVNLSTASAQVVAVNFATTNGTASAGTDYTETSGTLTFAPGQTSQSIIVPVIGDRLYEADETFFLNLSSANNAALTDAQGIGTILDNDESPSLIISDPSITERNNGTIDAVFTVNLSTASFQPVTVNFATANGTASAGTDYTTTNGTLTFAPGQTSQTITVPVIGDRLYEPDETFFINLSSANNAAIADAQGVGTILDNDEAPSLIISDRSITEGNNGTTDAVFSVNLSTASAQAVIVNFATANGTASAETDYTATSGTLTFTPGQTSQSITVPVIGDRVYEPDETFFLNLSSANNATIADAQAIGTIVDNDSDPASAIRAEGTVTINNGGDFDGNPLDNSDDALIYAGAGFTINNNPVLPVQRDADGNPLRSGAGRPILVDRAVVVAPGYSVSNAPNNQYANLLPPQVVDKQTVSVPAYADVKQQELTRRILPSTATVTFNAQQNPLNSASDWASKFPAPGTAARPTVVRVINGGLNIPSNVNLSHYVITVEQGDINFNGSGYNLLDVMLVTNNGNVNLATVQSSDLSVLASGSLNMNSGAKFAGSTLLAAGSSGGNITFNGATSTTDATSNLRVISQGDITYNGASDTRGTFLSVKNFTSNSNSTLYGTIGAKGNIIFNSRATVIFPESS